MRCAAYARGVRGCVPYGRKAAEGVWGAYASGVGGDGCVPYGRGVGYCHCHKAIRQQGRRAMRPYA